MKRAKPSSRPKPSGIRWTLVFRVLYVALPVTILLSLALWYLLLPDTQYRLRRYYLAKKYGNIDAYYPQTPVIPLYPDTGSSPTYQNQYVYRLNIRDATLREAYSRKRVAWPAFAVMGSDALYVSDGKSVTGYDESSQNSTAYFSDFSKETNVYVLPSTSGEPYIARTDTEPQRDHSYVISGIDTANKATRIIGKLEAGLYEIPVRIIDGDQTYMITGGGDGCGGVKKAYILKDGMFRFVTQFGEGCVEGPRYVGVLSDPSKLLAAAVLKPEEGENGPVYCRYDVLYAYDMPNGTVLPILDMKPIQGCVRGITYDRVTNSAVIVTDDKLHVVDVAKAVIVKSFANTGDKPYNFNQYGNILTAYVSSPNDKHIVVFDLATGTSKSIPWDFRNGRSPSVFGRDGDDLLVHTMETLTE